METDTEFLKKSENVYGSLVEKKVAKGLLTEMQQRRSNPIEQEEVTSRKPTSSCQ
jgi:hypothetical protein